MTLILVLSAVPAVLAAGLDSTGLALIAGAGLTWAAALYVCSVAPLVAGNVNRSMNETLAAGLSLLALVLAISGAVMIALPVAA